MAKVAEGMGRVANEIAANRKQRKDFIAEVKIATGRRHSDVDSFLQNTRSARSKATREQAEHRRATGNARHTDVFSTLLGIKTLRTAAATVQAAEGRKMTQELHDGVRSMLRGQKAFRMRSARTNHKEAVETNSRRQGEVKVMLDQFAREGVARRKSHDDFAEALHKRAAAFMSELTNGVAAFRDKLASDGRERAAEIRGELSAYARDRREGTALWRGKLQSRSAKEQPREAEHTAIVKSAPAPAVQSEARAPAPASASVNTHGADKAKSGQFGSGRHPAGQPQGRHRGNTK
jgi:hypothetical protein